ncbi:PdxT/SNO family [Xylaria bambusicola]|uniref:PdxT/SNO family n=1 Tax=Xylaria bambusicola TaxID=326684 RepID=UPI0020082665|nr:PdxT/SNO family [Xylaria bambusicola]KAI0508705.1 PdxT/SNO family [Xylaria bambusicola]
MATIGVLALQGGFAEHLVLLKRAADHLSAGARQPAIDLTEVRTPEQLATCDALILPGGESTTLSLVAAQSGLLEPLRDFVKVSKKPVWGTCAGLILLCEEASATKRGGQELIGGLDVKVHRNHFGRQLQSFVHDVDLPFLKQEDSTEKQTPFPAVFIRAPVVDKMLEQQQQTDTPRPAIEILARYPSTGEGDNIVALRQGNVFGTSFHPELTDDVRIHVWWLNQVIKARREN